MKIVRQTRSDQWNADDFAAGPRTFTIAKVVEGKAEQPYDVELADGEGRVWRPPVTVLDIVTEAWGIETSEWSGRRVTLYRDPDVTFGKDKPGGIRISHMSDLPTGEKPFTTRPITVSRGRRKPFTVEPLKEEAAPTESDWAERIAASTSIDELRGWWQIASVKIRPVIEERVATLQAEADGRVEA